MRKSPKESATLYDVGYKKKGLDGNIYIIRKTKIGIKRWFNFGSVKPIGKKYYIHDNGGRPFEVIVKNKDVHIYKQDSNRNIWNNSKITYPFLVNNYKIINIWIGKSKGKYNFTDHLPIHDKMFVGNSILLQININRYVYIGSEIFEMTLNDQVIDYYSPVGNNDVPYPSILTKTKIYFLLTKKYALRNQFTNDINWMYAYDQLAGIFTRKGWKSNIKSYKMKTKLIQK
jgi:hypothetical protein